MKKTSIQAVLSKIKVDLQKELLIHFEKAIQALEENEGNIDEMKKKEYTYVYIPLNTLDAMEEKFAKT